MLGPKATKQMAFANAMQASQPHCQNGLDCL